MLFFFQKNFVVPIMMRFSLRMLITYDVILWLHTSVNKLFDEGDQPSSSCGSLTPGGMLKGGIVYIGVYHENVTC